MSTAEFGIPRDRIQRREPTPVEGGMRVESVRITAVFDGFPALAAATIEINGWRFFNCRILRDARSTIRVIYPERATVSGCPNCRAMNGASCVYCPRCGSLLPPRKDREFSPGERDDRGWVEVAYPTRRIDRHAIDRQVSEQLAGAIQRYREERPRKTSAA
jgi:hypothetical protein